MWQLEGITDNQILGVKQFGKRQLHRIDRGHFILIPTSSRHAEIRTPDFCQGPQKMEPFVVFTLAKLSSASKSCQLQVMSPNILGL